MIKGDRKGNLNLILTASEKGKPMQKHESILAIAGKGLEGDRYHMHIQQGSYSRYARIQPEDRQVTLIASQAVEEANQIIRQHGVVEFKLEDARRNLVVDDISTDDLNGLVGQRFMVGTVEMEGVELCNPCRVPPTYLGRGLQGKIVFEAAFQGKGGIRARIINDGILYEGDALVLSQTMNPGIEVS